MWTFLKSIFGRRRSRAEETPPGPKLYYNTPEDIEVSPLNCDVDDYEGESGVSPLARYGGLRDGRMGPVSCDYYPMSENLKQKFRQWRRAVLAAEDNETGVPPELEEEGMELARALKRELPQHKVYYANNQDEAMLIE